MYKYTLNLFFGTIVFSVAFTSHTFLFLSFSCMSGLMCTFYSSLPLIIFFCILYVFLFLTTLADRYKNRSSYRGRLLVVLLEGKGLAARDSNSGKSLFHWHQTDSEIHGTVHKHIIWIFSLNLFASTLTTVREVPNPSTFFVYGRVDCAAYCILLPSPDLMLHVFSSVLVALFKL